MQLKASCIKVVPCTAVSQWIVLVTEAAQSSLNHSLPKNSAEKVNVKSNHFVVAGTGLMGSEVISTLCTSDGTEQLVLGEGLISIQG